MSAIFTELIRFGILTNRYSRDHIVLHSYRWVILGPIVSGILSDR